MSGNTRWTKLLGSRVSKSVSLQSTLILSSSLNCSFISSQLIWSDRVKNSRKNGGRHTDNQIYGNVRLAEQVIHLAKEPPKFLPLQQLIGLQVIDTKGSLIGNVKDISLDFENKDIALKVATKSRGEMDFGWDDVQSVEDVVLLKKQVDTPPLPPDNKPDSASEQTVQAVQAALICPGCGASSPARAKFCSKCGAALKS